MQHSVFATDWNFFGRWYVSYQDQKKSTSIEMKRIPRPWITEKKSWMATQIIFPSNQLIYESLPFQFNLQHNPTSVWKEILKDLMLTKQRSFLYKLNKDMSRKWTKGEWIQEKQKENWSEVPNKRAWLCYVEKMKASFLSWHFLGEGKKRIVSLT